MSSLNKEKLEEVIKSGNFDELIGKYENEYFDCKSQPYILNDNKNKRELGGNKNNGRQSKFTVVV